MKKINYFLVGLLATTVLAGCGKKEQADDFDPELYPDAPANISGGTFEERMAIREATNFDICLFSGLQSITPSDSYKFSGNKADYVKATTKQNVTLYDYDGEDYVVNIVWGFDTTKGRVLTSDAEHVIYEIAFPQYGESDFEFTWTIKSMSCGGASTTNTGLNYRATAAAVTMQRASYTIAQINSVNDYEQTIAGIKYPSTFKLIDYENEMDGSIAPLFPINGSDGTYRGHYAKVPGEVIYYAPDGNWALLGDGNQVLEFYTGAGTKLKPENFPNLGVGNKVEVYGKMDHYHGNVQLGIISQIDALNGEAASAIQTPNLSYPALTESDLSAFHVDGYTFEKQAIEGFMNSLHSVTGTLVPGSIRDNADQEIAASALTNARFSFKLKVGSEEMTVAYDYHTDNDGAVGLFNALKAKVVAGGQMTIKGTMRYSGSDEDDQAFNQNGVNAVWTIVPFLANHVA